MAVNEPLRLYTGKMGHGKTLRAVYDLVNEIVLDEQKPKEQQRNFYANIEGLKIDGVKYPPDDWRELPNNSLVIYDEADLIDYYKASSNKNLSDVVRETKLARKRDIHIWFIVQHPNQLNVFIRRIIGEHIHARRPLGAEMTKLYFFPDVCDDPTDFLKQKKAEKTKLFHFPKELYDVYESADVGSDHRQKRSIPESYIKGIIIFLALVIGSIYLGYSYFSKEPQKIEQKQQVKEEEKEDKQDLLQPIQPPQVEMPQVEQPPLPLVEPLAFDDFQQEQVSQLEFVEQKYLDPYVVEVANYDTVRPVSVIKNGDDCMAWNKYGDRLILDKNKCSDLLDKPQTMPHARDNTSSMVKTNTVIDERGREEGRALN